MIHIKFYHLLSGGGVAAFTEGNRREGGPDKPCVMEIFV